MINMQPLSFLSVLFLLFFVSLRNISHSFQIKTRAFLSYAIISSSPAYNANEIIVLFVGIHIFVYIN